MAKNNNRNQSGRHNNNPHGHNQHTNQWMETARDHPIATAAAAAGAAGAVAAGVYLWSHRNEVGNQVNKISRTASEMGRKASEKASEWTDQMRSNDSDYSMTGSNESGAIGTSRRSGSQSKSSTATRGQSSKSGLSSRTGAQTAS
jgi:uncharacterized protein HemX